MASAAADYKGAAMNNNSAELFDKTPGYATRVIQIRPAGCAARREPGNAPSLSSPLSTPCAAIRQDLRKGRVLKRSGDMWRVMIQEDVEEIEAVQATGCLLQPQEQDLVLVLYDIFHKEHFILNVLHRESNARMLDFPGETIINAHEGGVKINVQNFEITAERQVAIRSHTFIAEAFNGVMNFISLNILSQSVKAGFHELQAVGNRMRIISSYFLSRIGRSVHSVAFELRRAVHLRTEVKKRYSIKADRVTIVAKKDVSIDADSINIG